MTKLYGHIRRCYKNGRMISKINLSLKPDQALLDILNSTGVRYIIPGTESSTSVAVKKGTPGALKQGRCITEIVDAESGTLRIRPARVGEKAGLINKARHPEVKNKNLNYWQELPSQSSDEKPLRHDVVIENGVRVLYVYDVIREAFTFPADTTWTKRPAKRFTRRNKPVQVKKTGRHVTVTMTPKQHRAYKLWLSAVEAAV